MLPSVKDGAIFIADAHESEKRNHFWDFLCEIEKKNIIPSQLFLMGDIFDLLVGDIEDTEAFASPYMKKLEKLASDFPIYYFEGNHDFNISNRFQNITIFPIDFQPVRFSSPYGDILISHGDCFEDISYKIYTKIIRNKIVCKILGVANKSLNFFISGSILKSQKGKNLCKDIKNFESIIREKLPRYNTSNVSFILEGHYHQNKKFSYKNLIYQNFSSFACDKSYFVVQFEQGMKITQKKLRNSHGDNL